MVRGTYGRHKGTPTLGENISTPRESPADIKRVKETSTHGVSSVECKVANGHNVVKIYSTEVDLGTREVGTTQARENLSFIRSTLHLLPSKSRELG